ncbi:sporulation protein YqfC [Pseudoflavonifractor gallinarum]|uniref:YabP/YqfC family sporulation protein n=1 Tax=Pseudoflavonifractor gallinarum TaxID=2779352 RepID=UPI0036F22896
MAGKRKKESVLERTAQVFDLPGDLVAGLPRMELIGDRELRMENHRGILAYGSEEIHISGGKLILKVRGEGLELRSMNAGELLITGQIRSVELD